MGGFLFDQAGELEEPPPADPDPGRSPGSTDLTVFDIPGIPDFSEDPCFPGFPSPIGGAGSQTQGHVPLVHICFPSATVAGGHDCRPVLWDFPEWPCGGPPSDPYWNEQMERGPFPEPGPPIVLERCQRFEIPSAFDWVEFTCWWSEYDDGDTIEERLADCGEGPDNEPPCIDQKSLPTAAEVQHLMGPTTDMLMIRVVGSCGDQLPFSIECMETAANTAWAMMIDNIDLIDWALCFLGRDGDCVKEKILGESNSFLDPVVKLSLRCDVALTGNPAWTNMFLQDINVDITHPGVSVMFEMFCDPASSIGRKTCGAVALAALFFHEAMHLCWADLLDSPGECSVTYLAQNIFLWMMHQRYPDAGQHWCCTEPQGFFDDNVHWPSAGC